MNSTITSTWVIVGETIIICVLAFALFKGCNEKVIINTKTEDSLKVAAKFTDSTYLHYKDSTSKILDLTLKSVDYWKTLFNGTKSQLNSKNSEVASLLNQVDRLKRTENIDSLNKAISVLQDSYLAVLELMNNISQNCDSITAKQQDALAMAKTMLSKAEIEITNIKVQRDAALKIVDSKNSDIIKLTKQKKANNLWAKIATVWGTLATVVAIFKN